MKKGILLNVVSIFFHVVSLAFGVWAISISSAFENIRDLWAFGVVLCVLANVVAFVLRIFRKEYFVWVLGISSLLFPVFVVINDWEFVWIGVIIGGVQLVATVFGILFLRKCKQIQQSDD